jgi:hypothetical protein
VDRFDKTIEIVNGEIIGDSDQARGILYNGNRQQSPTFSGDTIEDIRRQAVEYADKIKADYGDMEYNTLYPNGLELRIWEG